MSDRVYQAGPVKRRRRTVAQVEQVKEQSLDVLEDHPQSVRHVFYRMTDPRLPDSVERSARGYAQVQDRIVQLRRSGVLPYGWITDATRRGYFIATFTRTAGFIRRVQGIYRADLWQYADDCCDVWVESRSIAGVVQAHCEELAVSLYPCGGFASITLLYEAAEAINARDDGRPVSTFYIGDFDPAGVLVDVALELELRKHLKSDILLTFTRVGITAEQITAYDLPTKPRKDSDRRTLHITETVEAEAMPQGCVATPAPDPQPKQVRRRKPKPSPQLTLEGI